jgi:glutamine synthetase
LLQARLDGVRRGSDPGPPQQGNTYDVLAQGAAIEKVPESLGAALNALAKDEVVKSALPGRLYKVFDWYKRDEWERYLAAVTDWEREEYLEVLP